MQLGRATVDGPNVWSPISALGGCIGRCVDPEEVRFDGRSLGHLGHKGLWEACLSLLLVQSVTTPPTRALPLLCTAHTGAESV